MPLFVPKSSKVVDSSGVPRFSRRTASPIQLTRAYGVLAETGRRAAYDHVGAYATMKHNGYKATYQITLTAAEACQGTTRTLSFHWPDGRPNDIVVSLPPGCRHGDRIRLAGRGGPSIDSARYGDLVIELIVTSSYRM